MGIETGRKFWELTKYQHLGQSEQERGLPIPPLELPIDLEAAKIPLPDARELAPKEKFTALVNARRTVRTYSETELTLEELAYLLWCTQGVRKVTTRPSTSRSVPSAGARHALETLLLVNRVDGLKPGLYRYAAIDHALVPLKSDSELPALLRTACLHQDQIPDSAVTFFWHAAMERMFWRYAERGYRYLHLDAGHACQNLALGAEQIGCGICPIAAFDDEMLNQVLGLNGEDQFVIYLATVGKKIVAHE